MTPTRTIPDAALAVLTAALDDGDLLHENNHEQAARAAQYLINSGFTITPNLSNSPPAEAA